jgi:hypothetical protein
MFLCLLGQKILSHGHLIKNLWRKGLIVWHFFPSKILWLQSLLHEFKVRQSWHQNILCILLVKFFLPLILSSTLAQLDVTTLYEKKVETKYLQNFHIPSFEQTYDLLTKENSIPSLLKFRTEHKV